ncbi:MAG: heme exporter protein CcmB [Cyclobacteriaceae bacterium]
MKTLILKEFRTEIRRQSAFSGLVIYVVSSVFVCYTAMGLQAGNLSPQTWSALFWIILLFSSFGIVGKSFLGEKKGVLFYYHSLVSPGQLILAKILYATLLTGLLSLAGLLIFITLLGNPIADTGLFLACLLLGASGFGTSLTLISAIAARAGNSGVLMAVLGFPVVLSILVLCIRVTKHAIDGLGWEAGNDELLSLLAISGISGAASYLLFPYIWRS